VGTGAIGAVIGTQLLFRIAVAIMAGSYIIWLAAGGYGGLVAFAICLGLGYGLRIALMPAVLIEFFGLSNLGALLGTFFTAGGIAAIIGPVAAAAVMDMTGGSFTAGILLALGLGLIGLLAVLPLPRPGPPGH
jgi:MFS family permease